MLPSLKQSSSLALPNQSSRHFRSPQQRFVLGWSRGPGLREPETAADSHTKVQQQLMVRAEDGNGSQPAGLTGVADS